MRGAILKQRRCLLPATCGARGGGLMKRMLQLGLLAVLTAGCGEGHAIFNVDVLSFMAGQVDTVDYVAPPVAGVYDTTTTPIEITMFAGLGQSSVDTVRIDATADLI